MGLLMTCAPLDALVQVLHATVCFVLSPRVQDGWNVSAPVGPTVATHRAGLLLLLWLCCVVPHSMAAADSRRSLALWGVKPHTRQRVHLFVTKLFMLNEPSTCALRSCMYMHGHSCHRRGLYCCRTRHGLWAGWLAGSNCYGQSALVLFCLIPQPCVCWAVWGATCQPAPVSLPVTVVDEC